VACNGIPISGVILVMTTRGTRMGSGLGRGAEAIMRFRVISVPLVVGVLIGLVVAAAGESEYLRYRSVPREQATIVGQRFGPNKVHCHRITEQEVLTTFRVAGPRPGFPAEFTISTCPSDIKSVGEQATVARKDASSWPDAAIDPPESQLQIVGIAGLSGVAGFGLGLVLRLLRPACA
jgi:hypothetical protein